MQKGTQHSDETKAKISARMFGRKNTEATIEKRRQTLDQNRLKRALELLWQNSQTDELKTLLGKWKDTYGI